MRRGGEARVLDGMRSLSTRCDNCLAAGCGEKGGVGKGRWGREMDEVGGRKDAMFMMGCTLSIS